MAKKTQFKTKSSVSHGVIGILLLILGAVDLLMTCFCMAGVVFGNTALSGTTEDMTFAFCFLGTTLGFGLLALLSGIVCLQRTLLPKTLHITDDGLLLFWFSKQVGNVPFANVKDVLVKTRAMAGETADGAVWQGFLAGGIIGAIIARSRFDPDESIAFVIRLSRADDPNTFWPRGFFQAAKRKRLDVHYSWELSHAGLVQKIAAAFSRFKRYQFTDGCQTKIYFPETETASAGTTSRKTCLHRYTLCSFFLCCLW